jgi:outer membrane protein TolC
LGLFAKDQVPSVKEDITKTLAIENINEAKLKALKFRPEFKAINLSKDIAILERKFAKNQMLPELDLFINQGVETGEDSIGPTTAAGVNLSIPLRVRTGQGLKKQAELSLQSLNLASRELMQNVILELENAVSELEQSKAKTKFAKESLILANQLFEGESEKFKLGDSTLFLVIRRQRAMAEANIQYYKAFADYRTAEQVFKFLQGELI